MKRSRHYVLVAFAACVCLPVVACAVHTAGSAGATPIAIPSESAPRTSAPVVNSGRPITTDWAFVYDPATTKQHHYPRLRPLRITEPGRDVVAGLTHCNQAKQAPPTIYDEEQGSFSSRNQTEEAVLVNKNCRPDSATGEDRGQHMVSHIVIRNRSGVVASARLPKVYGNIVAKLPLEGGSRPREALVLGGARLGGKGYLQWASVVAVEGTGLQTLFDVDPTIEYDYSERSAAQRLARQDRALVIEARLLAGKPELRSRERREIFPTPAGVGTPTLPCPPSPLAESTGTPVNP